MCSVTSLNGFSPPAVFTIKPRGEDLGESQVYQELLCFSTTPQHDWPCAEEVFGILYPICCESSGKGTIHSHSRK